MEPNVTIIINGVDKSKETLDAVSKNIEAVDGKTTSLREGFDKLQPAIKKATAVSTAAFAAVGAAVATKKSGATLINAACSSPSDEPSVATVAAKPCCTQWRAPKTPSTTIRG